MTITNNTSDLEILNKLKNDWSKPIQSGINCIDYRNNHYSKKTKTIMKNNSAYMRNKTELQKYDPNYKPPKGKFYKSHFNEFMMEFNKVKDKKGGSFETLQAKKARIIDKEEYDTLTDAHKNPQHGHKPTNKLSKENREIINRKLSNEKENNGSENKENKIEHPLCICKTNSKYNCTNSDCKGTFVEQYSCIRCDCPELFFGETNLAAKLAKHDRPEAK